MAQDRGLSRLFDEPRGRHAKPRPARSGLRLRHALLAAAALLLGAAAVLVAVSDDTRVLRAATILALLGALPLCLLLVASERGAPDEQEIAELRRELVRLRADVAAFASMPRPRAPEQVTTTLDMPLVRAALATPSNGKHAAIDLTAGERKSAVAG